MHTKIVMVLSLATLALAAGCAPAATSGMSAHATFASAPEYGAVAGPSVARPLDDPRPAPAKIVDNMPSARPRVPASTAAVVATGPTQHM